MIASPLKNRNESAPSFSAGVNHLHERLKQALQLALPAELNETWSYAQELMREIALPSDPLLGTRAHGDSHLPIDLYPLCLSTPEWELLQRGLIQRVRAWNALLKDLYSDQEILKMGVLPYELVLQDPRFLRPCVNVPVVRDIYVHALAVDLVRDVAGQWYTLDDHVANPSGAAFAIQIRRVMGQASQEIMEGLDLMPIQSFPTQLLETLQYAAPTSGSSARTVLLSPGVGDESFNDHSLLARQMGIPLVHSGDLIVMDGELFFKTITGLERVDVVYRRQRSDWIDPVSFPAAGHHGVAGMLSCVRRGTVTVANAFGAGLIENRGFAAYLHRITEFYLNERLLLPPLPTYLCNDLDRREEVLEHLDRYILRPVHTAHDESGKLAPLLSPQEPERLRQCLHVEGARYVAQRKIDLDTQPSWLGNAIGLSPVTLRLFALQGSAIQVSPCALSMVIGKNFFEQATHADALAAKDTWIIRQPDPGAASASYDLTQRSQAKRMRLGTRAADCLFWIGRYAERAEATVTLLYVIQQLQFESGSLHKASSWHPLWEALANATGHPTSFFKRTFFRSASALARYVLLDPDNLSSAISCLNACRNNAQQVREAISPEVWQSLNALHLKLTEASQEPDSEVLNERILSLDLHRELLNHCSQLSGVLEKHMLHNDAWFFWQIGRHLERALFTVFTMRQVFLKLQDERSESGGSSGDAFNLDALLRMLEGLYAYRSSYHSRPQPVLVAKMLLQDKEFPRSVTHNLSAIREYLSRCFGLQLNHHSLHLLHECEHLSSEIYLADISQLFASSPAVDAPASILSRLSTVRDQTMSQWLDSLSQRLLTMGTLIADFYVDQQARGE